MPPSPPPPPPPPPRGEVGDDGKETGNLSVARRKGGGEGRVGDYKPLDGVVLLDGGVREIFKRNDHNVSHLHLRGLVRHAVVGDACDSDKLTLLEEGTAPHRLPTYPDVLVVGNPHPTAPHIIHADGRDSVLGTCSDHGGLNDGCVCIHGHLLAEFLLRM